MDATAPSSEAPPVQLLKELGDDALTVILEHVTRGNGGPADIARVSCVCRRMRGLALEQMRRMRVLVGAVTSLIQLTQP
jgi:hypothetical protein